MFLLLCSWKIIQQDGDLHLWIFPAGYKKFSALCSLDLSIILKCRQKHGEMFKPRTLTGEGGVIDNLLLLSWRKQEMRDFKEPLGSRKRDTKGQRVTWSPLVAGKRHGRC